MKISKVLSNEVIRICGSALKVCEPYIEHRIGLLMFLATKSDLPISRLYDVSQKELIEKNNPKLCYYYARYVKKDKWKEGEDIIKTNAEWSYLYASDVIGGRWEEGEDAIKTDAKWSYFYARDVIKGRWQEGEDIIKTNAEWSYLYASDVIGGRWEEAESAIRKNSTIWKNYKKKFNL